MRSFLLWLALVATTLPPWPASADIPPRQVHAPTPATLSGPASWYGGLFHGRRMSNGQHFDRMGATAAHRWLPLGTRLRVTHPATGASEIVTVTDRGPHVAGRVLDVSQGTARRIGLERAGVAVVHVEVVR